MDVVVVGGHGQIGLRLLRLAASRGDRARGLIRNPDHATDLEAAGAEPVVCDLEADDADVTGAVAGADAIVFAAGAGPGSGAERKRTVDLGGALKSIDAAKASGVERLVVVSSMGADDPPPGDEVFAVYLRAKADADRAAADSGLDCTIVRPGRLTDDPGAGKIEAAPRLGRRGQIPRDDVAAVLLATLDERSTIGMTFEVLSGDHGIVAALAAL